MREKKREGEKVRGKKGKGRAGYLQNHTGFICHYNYIQRTSNHPIKPHTDTLSQLNGAPSEFSVEGTMAAVATLNADTARILAPWRPTALLFSDHAYL